MATPSPSMGGKGILFVTSKISRPDVLDVPTYIKWYEEDHIAEVVETSGINSARRFVHVDPKAEKPYLAMYALDDLAFLLSDEFRKIRVQSDLLPSPGIIYDLADVDVRYDNLVHVFEKTQKGRGAAKTLVVVASRLKEGVSPQDLDRWYREEHCELLSKNKSYLRTTRFKLAYARTNAQSRVLKGLAASTDELPPDPPTWLALHEFECDPDELDVPGIRQLTASPLTDKVLSQLDVHEVNIYRLANEFGNKDWFHGVDM
ncbi:unnamed protein product [Clonostachys rosea]|uniref:EthD domain-containing protein n=1 Tax=Bionectria ochroleuca TaxID=29856 RepID=A0ABY6U789_BIOOC|nr:unnamed protein product [Clonostachys rosea]